MEQEEIPISTSIMEETSEDTTKSTMESFNEDNTPPPVVDASTLLMFPLKEGLSTILETEQVETPILCTWYVI